MSERPLRRLDWLVAEARRTVTPADLGVDEVFHYSIPVFDELGDGRLEPPGDIGSDKLLLCGGEVLLSKLNPRIPRVLLAASHGVPTVASTEFIALQPGPEVEQRFLRYWLASDRVRQDLDGATMSVTRSQQRVRPDVLTKMWVNFPSLGKQLAIAEYLDAETERIDALIAKKGGLAARLAERLLQETRQLVVGNHLLSDPFGVDQEDLSPGWRSLKLGRHLVFGSGTTPRSGDPQFYGPGVPWIVTGDLRDRELADVGGSVTEFALTEYSALKVHPAGSLVVAMYGATAGRLGLMTFSAAVNQACNVIRKREGIDLRFLFFYLLAYRSALLERCVGAGQPNISQDILRSLVVAAPELVEQERIAARILANRSQVDNTIDKLERQIELLHERRRALITAAVTGELDILGAA